MKYIYIVVDQGFSSRYLLRSKIFNVLKNSKHGIIILFPNPEEKALKNEFENKNVKVLKYQAEKYKKYHNSSLLKRFLRASFLFIYNNYDELNHPKFWLANYLEKLRNRNILLKIYSYVFSFWILSLRKSKLLRNAIQKLEIRFSKSYHKDILKKYPPAMMITTSTGNLSYDQYIMSEGKKHNAFLVSMILSWDNPTTKGLYRIKPNFIIAWTYKMKRELIKYHGIEPEKIWVGGVTQYDDYFNTKVMKSRNELCEIYNLKIKKKIILFCLMSPTQYPWNVSIVERIAELIERNKIVEESNLIVRLHPIYFRIKNGQLEHEEEIKKLFNLKKRYSCLFFDKPQIASEKMSFDLHKDDSIKLGSLLLHADVLLCFFSSMMIESCIFDTPVINVAIENKNELPVDVAMNHNHVKWVLETNGTRTAKTLTELTYYLNMYLEDPKIDKDGRKKVSINSIGPYKGFSGDVIGKKILEKMEIL